VIACSQLSNVAAVPTVVSDAEFGGARTIGQPSGRIEQRATANNWSPAWPTWAEQGARARPVALPDAVGRGKACGTFHASQSVSTSIAPSDLQTAVSHMPSCSPGEAGSGILGLQS